MSLKSNLIGVAVLLAGGIGAVNVLSAKETAKAASAAPIVLSYATDVKVTATAAVASQPVAPKHEARRDVPGVDCAKQAWPHVARECLAAAEGTPVRKVSRTISLAGR
jgi:hypothetical protein